MVCRLHTTKVKWASGDQMQPAPQLAGHGSNLHKVVCGLAKALLKTLLHSIAKSQYRWRLWNPGLNTGLATLSV